MNGEVVQVPDLWAGDVETIRDTATGRNRAGVGITQDYVKSILDYDPNTGLFKWKENRGGTARAGDIAGGEDGMGYWRVRINSKKYKAHRLAWLYVYGNFPSDIDHINRNRMDNRISNLRECTSAQNHQNRNVQSNNKTGVSGVSFYKKSKKWRVEITINQTKIYIGLFDSVESAVDARAKAKKEFHKFNPNQSDALSFVRETGCSAATPWEAEEISADSRETASAGCF